MPDPDVPKNEKKNDSESDGFGDFGDDTANNEKSIPQAEIKTSQAAEIKPENPAAEVESDDGFGDFGDSGNKSEKEENDDGNDWANNFQEAPAQ